MCIIAFKPEGTRLPKEKILNNCYYNNSDGVGMAIQRNGKTIINKFMLLDPFLQYHRDNARKEDNILYHFRIATHGKVNLENTHPFIITKDYKEMNQSQSITTKNILAHNGIITLLADNHKTSDSKILARILADKDINDNLFKSEGIRQLIETILETDKLIVMNSEGEYFLIGKWEEAKGIHYSNLTYMYKKVYYDYYFPSYASEYSRDISRPATEGEEWLAKQEAEADKLPFQERCPIKNAKCSYCNTTKDVFYYFDIEENLCERCFHLIYEMD